MSFQRLGFVLVLCTSGLPLSPALGQGAAPPAPPAPPAKTIALIGKVSGPYTVSQANPDTGKKYTLAGSGTVAPLGSANVNGSFVTPGNIANGHAEGSITLTGAQGSVTVKLVGPQSGAFAPPPTSFDYTITAGAGAFAGATGTGKAGFSLADPTLSPGKSPGPSPTYGLTFGANP